MQEETADTGVVFRNILILVDLELRPRMMLLLNQLSANSSPH